MKNLLLLFITLILQVLQAIARATFYHINALSDFRKITIKIKQVFVFHATKSKKCLFFFISYFLKERLTSCTLEIKWILIAIERY